MRMQGKEELEKHETVKVRIGVWDEAGLRLYVL